MLIIRRITDELGWPRVSERSLGEKLKESGMPHRTLDISPEEFSEIMNNVLRGLYGERLQDTAMILARHHEPKSFWPPNWDDQLDILMPFQSLALGQTHVHACSFSLPRIRISLGDYIERYSCRVGDGVRVRRVTEGFLNGTKVNQTEVGFVLSKTFESNGLNRVRVALVNIEGDRVMEYATDPTAFTSPHLGENLEYAERNRLPYYWISCGKISCKKPLRMDDLNELIVVASRKDANDPRGIFWFYDYEVLALPKDWEAKLMRIIAKGRQLIHVYESPQIAYGKRSNILYGLSAIEPTRNSVYYCRRPRRPREVSRN